MKSKVIVVDGYSSGNLIAPELAKLGYDCDHVQSTKVLHPAMVPSFRPGDYRRNYPFDGDFDALVAWAKAAKPVAVMVGTETGVELADALSKNKYMKKPMSGHALQETVARYNSFVDTGEDADFDRPAPMYKIQTPPFYAAWATPVTHDTRSGLRVNARFQVHDVKGKAIPGLYCAGESAGGFGEHGIARCVVGGLIAGRNAAAEKV